MQLKRFCTGRMHKVVYLLLILVQDYACLSHYQVHLHHQLHWQYMRCRVLPVPLIVLRTILFISRSPVSRSAQHLSTWSSAFPFTDSGSRSTSSQPVLYCRGAFSTWYLKHRNHLSHSVLYIILHTIVQNLFLFCQAYSTVPCTTVQFAAPCPKDVSAFKSAPHCQSIASMPSQTIGCASSLVATTVFSTVPMICNTVDTLLNFLLDLGCARRQGNQVEKQ